MVSNQWASGVNILRCFAVIMALASVLISMGHSIRWTQPGVVYVGQGTSLWCDGSREDRAFRTIQQALDQALPGDVIRVSDGIYRERLKIRSGGVAGKPITIEAVNPGQVVLSWDERLSNARSSPWSDEGHGVLSASTKWPIYRLHLHDETIFREVYGGLSGLRTLVRRPGAMNAFCWTEGRVYVWLQEADRPKIGELITHRRAPAPREWGEFRSANIVIMADHVVVRGLDCRFGVGAGILLTGASELTIEDCAFSGATYGVMSLDNGNTSGPLTIRRCLYHHFPQYQWRRSWLSWNEVYVGHASSSLVATGIARVVIEDSIATHVGDGIRVSNSSKASDPQITVRGNIVAFGTDDAFEIEGPARCVTLRNNLVYECHESLGLSPVEVGPVTIERNVFLHERNGANGAQVKLINRDESPDAIQNIRITNNLFVGNWLCWMKGTVRNVEVTDNGFCVQNVASPAWPPGLTESRNTYIDWHTEAAVQSAVGHSSAGEIANQLERLLDSCSTEFSVAAAVEQRTGPAWWDWSHPATADLQDCLRTLKMELLSK